MQTAALRREVRAEIDTDEELDVEQSAQVETGNADLFIGWQVLGSGTYSAAYAAATRRDRLLGYSWEH
jgi:hypothetical protein